MVCAKPMLSELWYSKDMSKTKSIKRGNNFIRQTNVVGKRTERLWGTQRLGEQFACLKIVYFFYLFIFFSPSYIGWFKLNDYLYAQNCASLRYGSKVSMMAGRQLRRKATGILSEIQKWTQNHKTGHVYEVLYAICFVEEYNYKPSINPW